MPILTKLSSLWRTVVRGRRLDRDLDDELAAFLDALVVVRTTADPASLVAPLRELVAGLDRQLPIYDVRPLADYATGVRATRRFTMIMAVLFAAAALSLASIGSTASWPMR